MQTQKYIEFIMQDSINQYAVKNSKVTHIKQPAVKDGKVATTFSKEGLSDFGVNGIIFGSVEKLVDSAEDITHWTPNPFRYLSYNEYGRITNHSKDNIKQINTFVIDIDKDYTLNTLKEKLISAHMDNQVPFPNLYVKSPRGWHLYYALDNPMYINREQRSLYVANKVQKNILAALSHHIDVDMNCVPFGFFRLPTEDNVYYFSEEYISKEDVIEWSMNYSKYHKEKDQKKAIFTSVPNGRPYWVSKILGMTDIEPRNGDNACRNNTIFTLALYFFSVKTDYEKAFNILDEFNSNLNNPLNTAEFSGIMESAFSGKYNAPSKEYIQTILETWTDEAIDTSGHYFKVFYKLKKKREDRERSHYSERTQDIIKYLESNTDTDSLYINGNMKDILAQFDMPKSSFYDILNTLETDNIIYKSTTGKGRYSKTKIALFSNVLKKFYKLIIDKQIQKAEYRLYLESILTDILEEDEHTADRNNYYNILSEIRKILNKEHRSNQENIQNGVMII